MSLPSFAGIGITEPTLLLPPEGQDVAEAELTEALGTQVDQVMNPSKTGGTLHMVQQTPMQSNQQTTFWHVLPEDAEHVDSVDAGNQTQLKVKNSQLGGNEPMETPRLGRGTTQEKVPGTAEVQEGRCESNSRQATEPHMGCMEFVRFFLLLQEPLQEWPLGPLDIKEEPLDVVQGEIPPKQAERCRGTQRPVDGEVAVAEGQDLAEAELSKALGVQVEQVMNPLHMAEQTSVQARQQTTFWKVLQKDGGNVTALEGSLEPQLDIAPHPVKKEETDLPDPVQSLPVQEL
ncbi:hypothetical protein lerEdw1_013499, partial [Lerista edwardsae]